MMRFSLSPLSAVGILIVSTPGCAAEPAQISYEESVQCFKNSLIIQTIGGTSAYPDVHKIEANYVFWETHLESFGKPVSDVMSDPIFENKKWVEEVGGLLDENEQTAYVNSQLAVIDACEVKRKALQAG